MWDMFWILISQRERERENEVIALKRERERERELGTESGRERVCVQVSLQVDCGDCFCQYLYSSQKVWRSVRTVARNDFTHLSSWLHIVSPTAAKKLHALGKICHEDVIYIVGYYFLFCMLM